MSGMNVLKNMLRVGEINNVHPKEGMVDVLFPDMDNMVVYDIPLMKIEYDIPKIGEQALCLFLANGTEQGFCLGGFYSEKHPPPAKEKEIYKKQIDDDTYVEYNEETKLLKVVVEEVELEVIKGKVTVKAQEILLGDSASEGVPLGNQLKEWLDNHTHDFSWTSDSGNGKTSAPDPSPEPSKVVKLE